MGYKYEEVASMIKDRIYSGIYSPGKRLPSIQSLSKETGLNSDTIVKAYKQLEEEHLLYTVPKSGCYVMGNRQENRVIDLVNVHLADSINPYKDYCLCMEKAVELYGKRLFEYSSPKGMPELLEALTKNLMNFQIFTKPENLFITNGAQQALYILASMNFPGGGKKVLVEQPTYAVFLNVLDGLNVPVIGIGRTKDGFDLHELERIFQEGDIKFFYCMPRFQNPTGFSLTSVQKSQVIRLAYKYGVYIVEDDYLGDLEANSRSDSLYTAAVASHYGERCRILYIKSYSKTLLPGLRLGAAILPEELHAPFLGTKYCMDMNTSVLAQGALEIFLRSPMYKHHLKKIRRFYSHKMDLLKRACSQATGVKSQWHIPETGLYAYLELQQGSACELVRQLQNSSVMVSDTDNCYINGMLHTQGIRLCVCNATEEEIVRAIELFGRQLYQGGERI